MIFESNAIQLAKDAIHKSNYIVIFPHRNPDGDAIGSTLGLQKALHNFGKENVEIIAPNDFPKFLKWLPGAKQIKIADYNVDAAKRMIAKADLIFCLDFNDVTRIEPLDEAVKNAKATKVLIDHHERPQAFDISFSKPEIPATCQMVYHFLEEAGMQEYIDEAVATNLYTGILTDTGIFKYSSTQPETHEVAAKLLRHGAKPYDIQQKLFDSHNVSRLNLLGSFLKNFTFLPEFRTCIFSLSQEEMEEFDYQKGDTEGFVNYGLGVKNIVFSVFLKEDNSGKFVKMSLRSKGDFDVSKIAEEHFNGGGHANAAGGRSDKTIEETKNDIIQLLPNYINELNNA